MMLIAVAPDATRYSIAAFGFGDLCDAASATSTARVMGDIRAKKCRAAYALQLRSSTEISNERVRESTAPPRLGVRAWWNRARAAVQQAALFNQTGAIESRSCEKFRTATPNKGADKPWARAARAPTEAQWRDGLAKGTHARRRLKRGRATEVALHINAIMSPIPTRVYKLVTVMPRQISALTLSDWNSDTAFPYAIFHAQIRQAGSGKSFQLRTAFTAILLWRLQLALQPARCLFGFHRIGPVAIKALERARPLASRK
jgi:hypothetical protein